MNTDVWAIGLAAAAVFGIAFIFAIIYAIRNGFDSIKLTNLKFWKIFGVEAVDVQKQPERNNPGEPGPAKSRNFDASGSNRPVEIPQENNQTWTSSQAKRFLTALLTLDRKLASIWRVGRADLNENDAIQGFGAAVGIVRATSDAADPASDTPIRVVIAPLVVNLLRATLNVTQDVLDSIVFPEKEICATLKILDPDKPLESLLCIFPENVPAHRSTTPNDIDGIPKNGTVAGQVFDEGITVYVRDVHSDARRLDRDFPGWLYEKMKIRSVFAWPLFRKDSEGVKEVIAVLKVDSPYPNVFTESDTLLALVVASMTARFESIVATTGFCEAFAEWAENRDERLSDDDENDGTRTNG